MFCKRPLPWRWAALGISQGQLRLPTLAMASCWPLEAVCTWESEVIVNLFSVQLMNSTMCLARYISYAKARVDQTTLDKSG